MNLLQRARHHHLLAAGLLAVPLWLTPAGVQAQLPALGDGSEMTLGAERRLGDRIAREIYRDPDYVDDPVLVEYVNGVWQALLAAARLRGEITPELDERFAWEVMLDRDRTVNAFALPGGYMGVQLGLVAIVSNRDELASVMGHELSHVTQRHISRMMTRQNEMAPWVMGAMILGILAASKNPQAGNAVLAGGQAVSAQTQLNFSRDVEREADRVGFAVMTQAGFDPQGFVSMFQKLQLASRLNDNGAFPYLRSHPLTTERIADMQDRVRLQPGVRAPVPASMEHAMMTARARVIANAGIDALRAALVQPTSAGFAAEPPARRAGALYAAVMAAARLRESTLLPELLAQLTEATSTDPAAARQTRLLTAEVKLGLGDAGPAGALLQAGPVPRPELLLAAQALIQSGRAAQALAALQTRVSLAPRDASAWQWLASAYAAQGMTLASIRAEGEVQAARLDFAAALDRFKAGQERVARAGAGALPTDQFEASIIDARARQLESALREQPLER